MNVSVCRQPLGYRSRKSNQRTHVVVRLRRFLPGPRSVLTIQVFHSKYRLRLSWYPLHATQTCYGPVFPSATLPWSWASLATAVSHPPSRESSSGASVVTPFPVRPLLRFSFRPPHELSVDSFTTERHCRTPRGSPSQPQLRAVRLLDVSWFAFYLFDPSILRHRLRS